MSKASEIIILAEDQNERQQNLVRAYFKSRGYVDRQIRVLTPPVGKGQGIEWVKERYPIEAQLLRRAAVSKGLVVAIDGDDAGLEARLAELSRRLDEESVAPRGTTEAIAIVVPCRNVETWIWYLEGHAVDETTQYKRNGVGDKHDLAPSKRQFAAFIVSGQEPFPDCPSALKEARVELLRIPHR